MTNIEKLNEIFCEVFNVESTVLSDNFNKDSVDGWDSVHQLSLVAALEDSFDIMLDPEDIIGCTSYSGAKNILKMYDIQL